MFGKGGPDADVLPDTAAGLPPLNTTLAAEVISRTQIRKLLSQPEQRAIELTLVQLAQLAVDVPEIVGIDLHPLRVDGARIRIAPAQGPAADRLAIRPYPRELEEHFDFDGRDVLLRPLRPEDAPAHLEFLSHISEDDRHARFFRAVKELPASDLAYLTQIDYERAMAFIAVGEDDTGRRVTLGVVRAQADPDNEYAEFAVLVRSDLKGHGLGSRLMEKIIAYCRQRGTRVLIGDVLATNGRMLQLAAAHGFSHEPIREGLVRVSLQLQNVT
jgi:acetyltransferase